MENETEGTPELKKLRDCGFCVYPEYEYPDSEGDCRKTYDVYEINDVLLAVELTKQELERFAISFNAIDENALKRVFEILNENLLQTEQYLNLCDACKHDFATCKPAIIKFGTALTKDNVCACSHYAKNEKSGASEGLK